MHEVAAREMRSGHESRAASPCRRQRSSGLTVERLIERLAGVHITSAVMSLVIEAMGRATSACANRGPRNAGVEHERRARAQCRIGRVRGGQLYLRCARCALPTGTAACESEAANDKHMAVVTRPKQRTRFIDLCASLPESVGVYQSILYVMHS